MGQPTAAISSIRNISAFQLKVSARGAFIGAFFGSAWMFWAVVSAAINITKSINCHSARLRINRLGDPSCPSGAPSHFFRRRVGALEGLP